MRISDDQRGAVIAIACGTCVVLFLDLAMYLLRMNIFRAGQQTQRTYKMFANESFDRLTHPSFKLVLFSSFKHHSSVLGESLFRPLHEISAKYGFNNFEYHLRISENPAEPKWDEAYFKERVDIRAARVLINGPYGAAPQLKATLQKIGFSEPQFHWV